MRHSRTTLVAVTAGLLAAASLGLMLGRDAADVPGPRWKVTRCHDSRAVETVLTDEPHDALPHLGPGDSLLIEPFPDRQTSSGSSFASPNRLPSAERRTVEFLLLLPVATLLVCVCRNVIGLNPFGTFAPALLGLAFREARSPLGVAVLLGVFAAGWLARRGLNHFHLLQVPRTALMLSLVVVMLLAVILATAGSSVGAVTLFPLVILTGTIERFWSMEEEDGPAASLRTLATTLAVAGGVWLLAAPGVSRWLLRRPEALGLVMAAQLLLGRYTGLRLLEFYRFRVLIRVPRPRATEALG
jgi:hypothetical protein